MQGTHIKIFDVCIKLFGTFKVFCYQLMHKRIVFKGVIKFTLKLQLQRNMLGLL